MSPKRKRDLPEEIEKEEPAGTAAMIPAGPKLKTAFTGRLGYACINTVLRGEGVFTSRTCRLATIKQNGIGFAKDLAAANVRDIAPHIEWNERHNIRFMRLSSEIFPFASHEEHGYDISFAAAELRTAGDLAKKYKHRLTMHPGQYTLLSSPNPDITRRSVADLKMHADILDLMGMGADSVMIIHGGGAYGDKPSALQRIEDNIKALPSNIRNRLVLENDEVCYSVADLLPLCERTQIPLVLDFHHASLLPSEHPTEQYLDRILAIWKQRGIKPKMHYSESRPGAKTVTERRAHSDRVKILPDGLPAGDVVDLMIEAKDKEQAVFDLYERYGLFEVAKEARGVKEQEGDSDGKGKRKAKRSKKVQEEEEPVIVAGDAECCGSSTEEAIAEGTRCTRSSKKLIENC